jgi:hypothetical protein
VDKHHVAYPPDGILLCDKEEQDSDTCSDVLVKVQSDFTSVKYPGEAKP